MNGRVIVAKTYYVTLMLTVPEEDGHPEDWVWPELLDMPYDDVTLEDVREVE